MPIGMETYHIPEEVLLSLVQILTLTYYLPYTSSYVLGIDSPVRGDQKRVPYWGSSSYRFRVMAIQNLSQDSHAARDPLPLASLYAPPPSPIYTNAPSLRLLVSRLEVVGFYAALLRRRGPHIALHSVCPSVCLSVRPVIVFVYFFRVEPSYERTSKIEKLRFSLMGQRHLCTFRHAQRAAYRTAISAAQTCYRREARFMRVAWYRCVYSTLW